MSWEGLNPPYRTIVVDPPWPYDFASPPNPQRVVNGERVYQYDSLPAKALPYRSMTLAEIAALPVADLAHEEGCRLFLWTTNRYLFDAPDVLRAWGFEPGSRIFVWCKPPRGTMNVTTEFFLVGKRGSPSRLPWSNTTWFDWPLVPGKVHSGKPPAMFDLVESWSPAPRVELFARQPRLGWDHWGYGYEIEAS